MSASATSVPLAAPDKTLPEGLFTLEWPCETFPAHWDEGSEFVRFLICWESEEIARQAAGFTPDDWGGRPLSEAAVIPFVRDHYNWIGASLFGVVLLNVEWVELDRRRIR